MTTKMKSKLRSAALAVVLLCATSVYAQGGPGDPGDDPDPTRAVPFDGGLSLVVAAGLAYAAKKGRDKRKNQPPQNTQTEK